MNWLRSILTAHRRPGKIALPARVRRVRDLQREAFPHWTLVFTLEDGREAALTLHGRTRYWGWSVPCDRCMDSDKGPAVCLARPGCLSRPAPPQELLPLIEDILGGDPLQTTLDAASWIEYLEKQERRLLTELKSRGARWESSKAKIEEMRRAVRSKAKAQTNAVQQQVKAQRAQHLQQVRNQVRAQQAIARKARRR